MTRILCLWFPNWPIQRLVRSRPELSAHTVVLEAPGPRGQRVIACCSTAAAQGIRVDMPLAEAKALVRKLIVEPHNPEQDHQTLCALAAACERFSPCVAVEEGDEPESLLLDVGNLGHLLGTDAELAAEVEKFFTDRRYRVQIAVADTVGLAWAVAHYIPVFQPPMRSPVVVPRESRVESRESRARKQGAGGWGLEADGSTISNLQFPIAQLPVEALRITDDTAALLRELGVETVGQLLPLPRESLASRFGDQLLRRLHQLTGVAAEVLVPYREPAALEAGCSLEHPTADRAALAQVLAQLVEQLAQHLVTRNQGAMLLVCSLTCVDRRTVPLRIGLVEPSASAQQLMELVGLHLDTLALTEEVAHVAIQAAVVGRLGERQGELFVDRWPSDPHQLAVLLNRLSSRLGHGQVVRPQLRPSPLPERAVRYLSVTERSRVKRQESRARIPALGSGLSTLDSNGRPLLLYPEPQPIEVTCVVPDGPPQFVWLGNRREQIAQHRGPERMETLWWQGPSVRRDYYRIATKSASHLWIFRRLADGRWFLHGVFA